MRAGGYDFVSACAPVSVCASSSLCVFVCFVALGVVYFRDWVWIFVCGFLNCVFLCLSMCLWEVAIGVASSVDPGLFFWGLFPPAWMYMSILGRHMDV